MCGTMWCCFTIGSLHTEILRTLYHLGKQRHFKVRFLKRKLSLFKPSKTGSRDQEGWNPLCLEKKKLNTRKALLFGSTILTLWQCVQKVSLTSGFAICCHCLSQNAHLCIQHSISHLYIVDQHIWHSVCINKEYNPGSLLCLWVIQ